DRLRLQPRIVPEPLRMPHPATGLRPFHVLRGRREQAAAVEQPVDGEEQFGLGRTPCALDRGDRLLAVADPVAQLPLAQPGPLPGDPDLPPQCPEQVRDLVRTVRLTARGNARTRLHRHAAPPPTLIAPCTGDEPARIPPGHGRTPVRHTVRTGTVTLRTAPRAPHGRATRSPSVR